MLKVVDGLGNVVMHVVSSHFLSIDLLRSYFAIRGDKMQKKCTEISRVLTGGAIKQRTKVDLIDGVNDLRDERFLDLPDRSPVKRKMMNGKSDLPDHCPGA